MKLLKTFWKHQWPFWLGGLFVGLAEIVFYIKYDMFIVVTTGLAQMFAVPEVHLFGWDGVAQLYEPGIHWIIISALLGARLVAIAEGESRAWVKYDPTMVFLAFVGGVLFSFGTRLAAGCTTHHFIGGLAAMSTASWAVLLTGIPFAFLAFLFVLRLGKGGYYRHQDNLKTALKCHSDPEKSFLGYDPDYTPWKDPIHLFLTCFLLFFLGTPLYFSLFTPEIAGSPTDIGWSNMVWLMVSGGLMGFGIAKCGFGTECAIMSPHASLMSQKGYQNRGVPNATYAMFRGLLPLQGLMTAVVVFNLFILGSWFFGTGSIPNASGASGLYWGHLLGGPLLAIGAVFMIGCEVRAYARLGLGYTTALAALPGFYVGYLPYTFFWDAIDDTLLTEGLIPFITIPQITDALVGGGEAFWNVAYSLFLIGILTLSFVVGRRFLNVDYRQMLTQETDSVTLDR